MIVLLEFLEYMYLRNKTSVPVFYRDDKKRVRVRVRVN